MHGIKGWVCGSEPLACKLWCRSSPPVGSPCRCHIVREHLGHGFCLWSGVPGVCLWNVYEGARCQHGDSELSPQEWPGTVELARRQAGRGSRKRWGLLSHVVRGPCGMVSSVGPVDLAQAPCLVGVSLWGEPSHVH